MFKLLLALALTVEGGEYTERTTLISRSLGTYQFTERASVRAGKFLVIHDTYWTFVGEKRGAFWIGRWHGQGGHEPIEGRFWFEANKLVGEKLLGDTGTYYKATIILEKS